MDGLTVFPRSRYWMWHSAVGMDSTAPAVKPTVPKPLNVRGREFGGGITRVTGFLYGSDKAFAVGKAGVGAGADSHRRRSQDYRDPSSLLARGRRRQRPVASRPHPAPQRPADRFEIHVVDVRVVPRLRIVRERSEEQAALKHYMQVTWVSYPIPEDRPSEVELFGEFYGSEMF